MQREAAALATGYEHDDDDDDQGAWTWNDTKWILLQPAAVAVHSLLVACCLLPVAVAASGHIVQIVGNY